MKRVSELIQRCPQVVSNVLITGESGTGKELVAQLIHENSLAPRFSLCHRFLRRNPGNLDRK